MHEAKLAKMEAEMKMVFQQKVQEKEAKLKQSEEELYARHKEMRDALEKQRADLEEKKRRLESGRPLTPEKGSVSRFALLSMIETLRHDLPDSKEEGLPPYVKRPLSTSIIPFLRLGTFDVDATCAPTSRGHCLHCISPPILSRSVRLS